LLLVAYMAPVVYLAEQLARPADYVIETMGAPDAVGGVAIAIPPWCMNRLPGAAPSGFDIKRSGRRLACRALSSD
jgi:hypothetical protein